MLILAFIFQIIVSLYTGYEVINPKNESKILSRVVWLMLNGVSNTAVFIQFLEIAK